MKRTQYDVIRTPGLVGNAMGVTRIGLETQLYSRRLKSEEVLLEDLQLSNNVEKCLSENSAHQSDETYCHNRNVRSQILLLNVGPMRSLEFEKIPGF